MNINRQLPPDFDLKKDGETVVNIDQSYSEKMMADQSAFEAEIASAGGIDAWRAKRAGDSPAQPLAA